MDNAAESPAILTVFRSRLRREAASLDYHELAEHLERRARAMPGFVEFKTCTGEDGERVSIVIFDSVDHHKAWRDDTEHVSAQQRGIEEFYTEYQIPSRKSSASTVTKCWTGTSRQWKYRANFRQVDRSSRLDR